jgi:hypothetical protein
MALFGNGMAHCFQDGLGALLHDLGRNAGLLAGFAENGCVGGAVEQNARQRNLKARYPVDAGGEGIEVNAVAAAQQCAVDIEQIGILSVPGETRLDGNARFFTGRSCMHG